MGKPEEFLGHPIVARLAGMVPTTLVPSSQPRGGFFFTNNQNHNIMTKYITRDKLADFVEKMWDAGIKVDLKPKESMMTLWSEDLDKVEYVDVVDKRTYDSLVNEVKSSLLRPHDPGNIMNTEG